MTTSKQKPLVHRDKLFAALDLGSNSFHLLVGRFDGDALVVVDRHKETVRMASGIGANGALSAEVMRRSLSALSRIAERLRPVSPSCIRIVGTNTLRIATNGDRFLEKAEIILGAPISIISGIEEARLIYQGIACDVAPDGKRLVIDIGGGSTECVLGERQPLLLNSLRMGCVSFTDRFFSDGKLSLKSYQRALTAALKEVQNISKSYRDIGWKNALGSSGTIRAIERALDKLGYIEHHCVTLKTVERLVALVFEHRHIRHLGMLDLDSDRLSLLPAGLAILHAIFIEFKIESMHVSSYALREGLLYEMSGKMPSADIRTDTVARLMRQYSVDHKQAARVEKLALLFLNQAKDAVATPFTMASRILTWAARLHEIGLAIGHDGYHKHSAYVIDNGDLQGFSRQEQKILSFLVLNQRQKLKPLPNSYGFDPDWRLVQIFRLACLFCRRRDDAMLPAYFEIVFLRHQCRLSLVKDWLDMHPLTLECLRDEHDFFSKLNLSLVIDVF
ncbi:MAG TPA: Ppx/GppA phosphatase family protein [Pseudomonadales bacterium]|nr:Ppx/GppA phosphatase family protein [Pseudomonadales bacterium]HNN85887.1 Ppx/GppA phosphatase family protein [Pseudomonadales bacterium]